MDAFLARLEQIKSYDIDAERSRTVSALQQLSLFPNALLPLIAAYAVPSLPDEKILFSVLDKPENDKNVVTSCTRLIK